MTLKELSERVAHYCDEQQVEEENFFYTAVNGVMLEIAERFPRVASVRYNKSYSDSQTAVNINELVSDFASFSTPAVRSGGYSPKGHPTVDARTGEIIFAGGTEGEFIIYYNKKESTVTRDTEEIELDSERLELLVLGVAYRLLTIDADYNAAAYVKAHYEEYAARLAERYSAPISFVDVNGW